MLSDMIRSVLLEEGAASLTNEQVAARVVHSIAPEDQQQAFLEALRSVISMQRGQVGRQLLRSSAAAEISAQGEAASPPAAWNGNAKGRGGRFASPRTALLHEQVLEFAITGAGGRRVLLGLASIADVRFEIDVSRKRGTTLVSRAQIFDEMLHEMAALKVRHPRELPPESRAAYGRRIAELGSQGI